MPNEIKGLNEECGVFGVFGDPQASALTFLGLHNLQHRGQEGAGIVSADNGQLLAHRDLGFLAEVFADENDLKKLTGSAAIGHVRYGTSGSNSVKNIQPFVFDYAGTPTALAHNGNLTNAQTLRRHFEQTATKFQSNSDTELLMQIVLEQHQVHPEADFMTNLKYALNQVHGGFAFLLLQPDRLIAALDPHGFRPLCLGQLPNGAYVFASESCALDIVGAKKIRDILPGELLVVDKDGVHLDHFTTDTQLALCSMEFIYFARPDSVIHGVTVHNARREMGRRLAHEQPAAADIVVGVPNSSLSAAAGYAEAAHLPYEMGLIKNQYVARTFIQPTQALREKSVQMKLSAIAGVVAGKRVVMVDDSIVRGTTSKQIVRLLKRAGAKEVHVRIACPPFKYPCYYGIDVSTRAELLAANHSVAEMQQIIEADSLGFLSKEGLIKAINLPDGKGVPNGGLTTAYFDGKYPTPLEDYAASFAASLQQTAEQK